MKKLIVVLIGSTLLFGLSARNAIAAEAIFESKVVAIPAALTGAIVRTVPGGGARWVVARGEATLDTDGRLRVELQGLLSMAKGTTGVVTSVVASLTCERLGVVATTVHFTLTPAGDAQINDLVHLPAISCVAPIVLVRAVGAAAPWIAATGF